MAFPIAALVSVQLEIPPIGFELGPEGAHMTSLTGLTGLLRKGWNGRGGGGAGGEEGDQSHDGQVNGRL